MAHCKTSSQLSLIDILKKQVAQLDTQSRTLTILLTSLKSRHEKLSAYMEATKSSLENLHIEISKAQELIVRSRTQLSEAHCQEILKIKNPNTTLVDLACQFLSIIQETDQSWHGFKSALKRFELLKLSLSNIQPDFIPDSTLNSALHVWKSQASVQSKIKKYAKGVKILAELVSHVIECKFKKNTLEIASKEYLNYKTKANLTKIKIVEVSSQISDIEGKILEVKGIVAGFLKIEEEIETNDISYQSVECDNRRIINTNPFANGTASGGILDLQGGEKVEELLFKQLEVGDISEYHESPKSATFKEEVFPILYETYENFGCCRSRFFCF